MLQAEEDENDEEDALIEPEIYKIRVDRAEEEEHICFRYLSGFRKMCVIAAAAIILTQYK